MHNTYYNRYCKEAKHAIIHYIHSRKGATNMKAIVKSLTLALITTMSTMLVGAEEVVPNPITATAANTPTITTSNIAKKPSITKKSNKPLSIKKQQKIETAVFTILDQQYPAPTDVNQYALMYWENNLLYVAFKSDSDATAFTDEILKDDKLSDYVRVLHTDYSQAEYDIIMKNFEKYYTGHEPAGVILAIFPHVPKNQLIAIVSTASSTTRDGIATSFGDKIRMIVKR